MMFQFEPIGFIETCFKEKFGIPRQPGLTPSAWGKITFKKHPDFVTALQGLEGFSHLWVLFVFHESGLDVNARSWKPSVRPPRLGGAKKMGVLASRSPHRPNPIGMSVVKIEKIDLHDKKGPTITASGVDLLSGTPILDIKPYIEYCDSRKKTKKGFAGEKIKKLKVSFQKKALRDLKDLTSKTQSFSKTKKLITEILSLDPRPAFQQKPQKPNQPPAQYGFLIEDLDVHYQAYPTHFEIYEIVPIRK